MIAEMKDAKRAFALDKSARPTHRFVKTDVEHRLVAKNFRVKNL